MQSAELRMVLALAGEFKEGDLSLGGTRDEQVRAEARQTLAGVRLGELSPTSVVEDDLSEMLDGSRRADAAIDSLAVADLKSILVSAGAAVWVGRYRDALTSEAIAAVVKLMTEAELARLSRALHVTAASASGGVGASRHFGSRLQPNSPGDDEEEILFSVLEGLGYGCGDVLLGINPASDDLDTIIRLEELLARIIERLALPTRYCVLSDIVKQTRAREHTRVDVGFQSLAGTSRALRGMVGLDAAEIAELARGFDGLYFETGQGSEVTNGAAEGVDMVTLESRTYGAARAIGREVASRRISPVWMIVNDVAGFIGPEVFRSGAQLRRACLEDLAMARLHGLTMGLDICSTFHMGINPAELARLTADIVDAAAPAYLMAVAGNADPMLGYMTTSFREHPRLRANTGKSITTSMQARLEALGVVDVARRRAGNTARLYAHYARAGGDARTLAELEREASRKLERLQASGWDLGYGCIDEKGAGAAPPEVERRLAAIYTHARQSLYSFLDPGLIAELLPGAGRVRSEAADREDYLSHPAAGERIRASDAARINALYPDARPRVQLVVSDGLNANAVNENLRRVLPPLMKELAAYMGERAVVIENGRVRAGYHVGALLGVEAVIHLIGERPGTGIDTLSAYMTYGRDEFGRSRWSVEMDHSLTTAICGIHARGKAPEAAGSEIAAAVVRMLDQKRSGVALGGGSAYRGIRGI